MQSAEISRDERGAENPSPYLMWAIWLFWLFFLVQPAVAMWQLAPSLAKYFSMIGFVGFIGLYLHTTWRAANRFARTIPVDPSFDRNWWAEIAVMIALGIALCFIQGPWALGSFIYIAACVGGRLTLRQVVLVTGGFVLLVFVLGEIIAAPWSQYADILYIIPAVASIVYFFSRTINTNQELRLARREIARLAVSEERLRFARDLHDLLGHTLSLIALKSELAGQLIPEDSERACREVHEIEAASRTALQEVREAVAGYRQATLASELQRARELLAAAGIRCMVQEQAGVLPSSIEALLTWVVREGVTNVIRHSRAKQCLMTLDRQGDEIRLTVTDDGRGDGRALAPVTAIGQSGNGLRGIAERVAALEGRCEAGSVDGRGFRLAVALPLPPGQASRVPAPLQVARGVAS
jgi:two-component system sensor histidine kinase DesK